MGTREGGDKRERVKRLMHNEAFDVNRRATNSYSVMTIK